MSLPGEAVLHVGMTKAGSTAIQNALDARRAALLDQGILFPVSAMSRRDRHDPTRTSGHLHLLRLLAAGAEGVFLRECAAVAGRARRLVLSAENLLLDQPDEALARLAALLRGCRVTILAILRPQLDWLEARYCESIVRERCETRSIDRFALDALAAGQLDYGARLDCLASIFDAARVMVLDYDALRREGGVVGAAMRAIGFVLPPGDPVDARRDNVTTVSAEATEARRRVNVAAVGLPPAARQEWAARVAACPVIAGARPGTRRGAPPMSPAVRRRIEEETAPLNARLSRAHLRGAPFGAPPEARPAATLREPVVERAARGALAVLPTHAGSLSDSVGGTEGLLRLRDRWAAARVVLHHDGGDLALLAAGLIGKLVLAVEADPAGARRLQARSDGLDLPSPVIVHAPPMRLDADPEAFFESVWTQPFFRHPDVIVVAGPRAACRLRVAARRAARPVRALVTDASAAERAALEVAFGPPGGTERPWEFSLPPERSA